MYKGRFDFDLLFWIHYNSIKKRIPCQNSLSVKRTVLLSSNRWQLSLWFIFLFIWCSFYMENSWSPSFNFRLYEAFFSVPLESCHPDLPDDQSIDIHSLFHLPSAPLLTLESPHIILLLSLPRMQAFSTVLLLHTASRCISSQESLPDGPASPAPASMPMFRSFRKDTPYMILHCPHILVF